ncbi:MAG: TAXI family TRAP transporter solute-binding subunit [Candidatus Binatia bacterium]
MRRMNSRAMRAWTTLEIAAEVYRRRMFDLGSAVTLSIWSSKEEETPHPPLRVGVGGEVMGGMLAPIEVGKRRIDIAYVNPSAIVTMAYRGKGFYKEKLPLRALGSFPSWDKIAFAVSKDLKIKSLWELAENKIPLRVSTRASSFHNCTYYSITKILSLYGLSFKKIRNWGGHVQEVDHPSGPTRRESIRKRKVDAIFDEGITRWLDVALANGYEVLHIENEIIKKMEALGFKRSLIPKRKYPRLKEDIRTLDFSGWPIITHRWLSDDMARAICESIYSRRNVIPVDDTRVDMRAFCRDTEDAPLGIPLHPGARKYHKEKGYL